MNARQQADWAQQFQQEPMPAPTVDPREVARLKRTMSALMDSFRDPRHGFQRALYQVTRGIDPEIRRDVVDALIADCEREPA